MELSLKKVKQLTEFQIFQVYESLIKKIYKSFEYVAEELDFKTLVLEEIKKAKNSYDESIVFGEYLKNKINISINHEIKKLLLNDDKAVIIINNYINKNFGTNADFEDAIKSLKKLKNFFNKFEYVISPEIVMDILKNNKLFSEKIGLIVKKYNYNIVNGNVEAVFSDNSLIMIIESYCTLNGIEIKDDLETIDDIEIIDSLDYYLKEITNIPLLSREKEQELAQRISQGDDEAKKIFIESNLKLVICIAKKYSGHEISFLDLIQEGNIGLITAIERYDATRGIKFSTYATYWIKQSIQIAIAKYRRGISLPNKVYAKVLELKRTVLNLQNKLNSEPTIKDISNELGLTLSKTTKLHKLQLDTISLQSLVGEDAELENFISTSDNVDEDLLKNDLKYHMRKMLATCDLSEKQLEVIIMRYGLGDREPMSLEQIGKIYGMTRERIRQIEAQALMRLRTSSYVDILVDYTDEPTSSMKNIEFYREKYLDPKNRRKSFLNEDSTSSKPQKLSIYDYFKDYTKEQVDLVISKLKPDDLYLIILKYGADLENPVYSKLSDKQSNRLRRTVIPKIKRMLDNERDLDTSLEKKLVLKR